MNNIIELAPYLPQPPVPAPTVQRRHPLRALCLLTESVVTLAIGVCVVVATAAFVAVW